VEWFILARLQGLRNPWSWCCSPIDEAWQTPWCTSRPKLLRESIQSGVERLKNCGMHAPHLVRYFADHHRSRQVAVVGVSGWKKDVDDHRCAGPNRALTAENAASRIRESAMIMSGQVKPCSPAEHARA